MGTSLLVLLLLGVLQVHARNKVPTSCSPLGSNITNGYCASCFQQPPCKKVPVIPARLKENIFYTPLYIHGIVSSPQSPRVDNICYTYYVIDQEAGQYLLFASEVYADKTINVQIYFSADDTNKPGVAMIEGFTFYGVASSSEIVTSDYLFGIENGVIIFYRCFQFQNCNNPYEGIDYRYAGSNQTEISEDTMNKVKQIANNPKYQFRGKFEFLPNTEPWACVTRFHGKKCIGADTVLPENSIDFPIA